VVGGSGRCAAGPIVDPRFVTGAGPSGLCPIRSALHR
jgi:hypothetical protein